VRGTTSGSLTKVSTKPGQVQVQGVIRSGERKGTTLALEAWTLGEPVVVVVNPLLSKLAGISGLD
jgi:hypothetical protein